jgi:RluA family pseudouridine synthase
MTAPTLDYTILYEDRDILAVTKPAGLLSHASEKRKDERDLESLVQENYRRKPVLLHRLDRATSGLVLFGKSQASLAPMAKAFEEKRIRKSYLAVVEGIWNPSWTKVESKITKTKQGGFENSDSLGNPAATTFRLLATANGKSALEVLPKTGRTHQIRLHCLKMGCPVLGDRLYGKGDANLMGLHAYKVSFKHPVSGDGLEIICPLPESWRSAVLDGLEWSGKEKMFAVTQLGGGRNS